jgi:hypothetical protein
MGDALTVALIEKRGFKESDFYKFHQKIGPASKLPPILFNGTEAVKTTIHPMYFSL